MDVYTVYKYLKDWELTPFSFLRGAAFAGGSLIIVMIVRSTVNSVKITQTDFCTWFFKTAVGY